MGMPSRKLFAVVALRLVDSQLDNPVRLPDLSGNFASLWSGECLVA